MTLISGSAADGPSPAFQVLALDGGGVKGIFTAAVLAALEADLGRSVVDLFDLVVGTSTGGIIAVALGAGLAPREIVDVYVAEKDHIFPNRFGWRALRHPFRAKYRAAPLEAVLKRLLGDRLLGDSRIPLVVPAYNIAENDVYLFKTPHHERLRRDHAVPMWAVAMATSAAPSYFPAFRLPSDHVRLIDGGVWCNNPAMVGVIEAVSMFDQRPENVRVMSVGTTSTRSRPPHRLDNAGWARWASSTSVVDVLLNGQAVGAFAQVQHLVGAENAYRLDPPAPDGLAKLDACEPRELIAAAAHHSRIFCPTFERVFGMHQPAPYVALYGKRVEEAAHAHN